MNPGGKLRGLAAVDPSPAWKELGSLGTAAHRHLRGLQGHSNLLMVPFWG